MNMMNETDLTRADLNLLVLFEAVMEERSVTRAAARLRVSPSAVSHGLVRLRRFLNDPLFLKHPKGVAPTARAMEVAATVADILMRIRGVVAGATRFDPAHSSRRFTIGAPDGISAVILPPLFSTIERAAPQIDLSERIVMPQETFKALDTSMVDIVIGPAITEVPARFVCETLYEEEFVVAVRIGHKLAAQMTLDNYCAAAHLVVSAVGDPDGFVDHALEAHDRSRRVAFVAPSFMLALAILAETDLVAAIPRRLAQKHAARFGLVFADAPMSLETHRICAILPKAALADAGVAWLFGMLRADDR